MASQQSKMYNPKKKSLNKFIEKFVYDTCCILDLFQENFDNLRPFWRDYYGLTGEQMNNIQLPILDVFHNEFRSVRGINAYIDTFRDTGVGLSPVEMYKCLTPCSHDIKNYGHIFTPSEDVRTWVENIPPTILANRNSKFISLCGGFGTELIALEQKLMDSLKNSVGMRRESDRRDYIRQNMLYYCDINPVCCVFVKKLTGINPHHIYQCDINDLAFTECFIDAIFIHSPFDKSQTKNKTPADFNMVLPDGTVNKKKKRGGQSLWTDHLKIIMRKGWLKPNGYISMVVPTTIRKVSNGRDPSSGLFDYVFHQMTPKVIYSYNKQESMTKFQDMVSINGYDVICAMNTPNTYTTSTSFRDWDGNTDDIVIQPYQNFIPNRNYEYWERYVRRDGERGWDARCNSKYHTQNNNMTNIITSEFNNPILHKIHENGIREVWYSNMRTDRGGIGVKKIVLSKTGSSYDTYYDEDGTYGCTQNLIWFPVDNDEQARITIRFIDEMRSHCADINWYISDYNVCWKLFEHLRCPF